MNNKTALLAAVPIAFADFLSDSNLKPEQMTDYDRMLFQVAFTFGAEWALRNALERAKEGA